MIHIKGGETYPDFVFDEADPIPLADVVRENNGLPVSSRSMGEMWRDHNNDVRYAASQKASIARRKPRRREARFVVEYLDKLDAQIQKVGKIAIQHVHLLQSLGQASPWSE